MHNKQNNKESKTYVQGLRPFGNTLPRGIKGILKKNGHNYSEIISKWNLLVGNNISNFCYPKSIKVKSKNESGTLVLMVERGNEIDIEFSKKNIIDKINSYFGYKLINEIKLNTFNAAYKKEKTKSILDKFPEKFEKKINEIKNKDLRDSLLQLLKKAKK
jgi:hypothetical protein